MPPPSPVEAQATLTAKALDRGQHQTEKTTHPPAAPPSPEKPPPPPTAARQKARQKRPEHQSEPTQEKQGQEQQQPQAHRPQETPAPPPRQYHPPPEPKAPAPATEPSRERTCVRACLMLPELPRGIKPESLPAVAWSPSASLTPVIHLPHFGEESGAFSSSPRTRERSSCGER